MLKPLSLPHLLGGLLLCAAGASQAALEPLDNENLGRITGQEGLSIRADVMASIGKAAWVDDGGSVSLRNLKIDNGCTSAAVCPDGRGGALPLGAAQLGLSLPFFGVELPTLQVDVVQGSNGQQQLALTLPDLTTINKQLNDGGLPAQTIRVRVAGDLYVGESRLGSLEVRDIQDISGTIRVWGH
ncbi:MULTISPECIES: DUF6160 family protein [Pseudomonas]|jgi:hypothetical protein|uniref:Uncharacterized protein n=1 Tax=Pseudomonas citronellolis TaxID=53408 RepID=A0A1A9KJM5_9PSED|nr:MULTISPECIES: DUF6160 family protein [Pseudomonas]ANI18036.1 hypothetical protein A9C11_30355 [Pseudomonas citronellolis]KRV73479.1 hypothetical protein AO742_04450 [Pseudomonas citronellolis]KRW79377.1 hypothetical protein AO738_28360 [Pseudomonas citronellolis]KWR74768.1 hypothetical protein RN02_24160 [Pseudomonas sp. PI1]MBB1608595.1 hypothetical protein [Pseudomonas sp. UMC76]